MFSGTIAAPAWWIARQATTQCQVLGDQIATRSPGCTPSAISAAADRCTSSRNAAAVNDRSSVTNAS